jgi:ketosteroid isomerase-like protein
MSDTLSTLAHALVMHCRNGTEEDGLNTLYAPDCISVEAFDVSGPRVTEGLDGIRGKHAWWAENFEVHGGSVDGPHLHGDDRFAVIFEMDATHKESGQRTQMKEVAIYTIAQGKIVREEFFYAPDA